MHVYPHVRKSRFRFHRGDSQILRLNEDIGHYSRYNKWGDPQIPDHDEGGPIWNFSGPIKMFEKVLRYKSYTFTIEPAPSGTRPTLVFSIELTDGFPSKED